MSDPLWIVLKQRGEGWASFGPVPAHSDEQAIEKVALGTYKYVAQGHGRYLAVRLETWQGGCRHFTKTRGVEPVEFPRVVPVPMNATL